MRQTLESRIDALRGRARRLLAAHGVAWLLLGVIAAVAAAGALDWLIHLTAEVRLVLLIGVAAAAGWLLLRYVVAPLVVRFDDLDIALRIERRWPGLNDRLASTVQFLRQPDREGDSRALRDATVAQTLLETESIDFRQAIDRRPANRAMAWSALVLAAAGLVATAAPASTRIALDRLFRPFGPTEWPRLTHLSIVGAETPSKVARGDAFTLAVRAAPGERPPSSARVTYRFADGETSEESLRPADDGAFRGRLDVASRDFSFTVAGGDDVTEPWPVKVVPPPALTGLTVRVIPPDYTGMPPQTLGEGSTLARAVFGSRVELAGRANKPLAAATLRVGDGTSKEPASIAPGGLDVSARFPAESSVPFWFELRDTEGFRSQEAVRYDLRTVADEAPRVSFEEPTSDRDVPSRAAVPVRIAAEDDYGLHSIRLVYKVSAGGSEPPREVVLPLWDGQARAGQPASRKEAVAYRWDLAPLKLEPGSIITFHADARDFDNVKGPNIGKTRELRLRIVADADAQRQVEDQQRALRDDIERTLNMQRQAQTPVDEARRTLARTGNLPPKGRDDLKNAETIQRQVTSRVASKSDGIEEKVRRIQDDLANFNLPNPDVARQMQALREAVDRIKANDLTPAEQNLARADKALDDKAGQPRPVDGAKPEGDPSSRPGGDQPKGDQPKGGQQSKGEQPKGGQPEGEQSKGGQPEGGSKPEQGEAGKPGPTPKKPTSELALNDAAKNQKGIADELGKMLDSMKEFDTFSGLVKDTKGQLQEQEKAIKQAAEAAQREGLAGKTPEALTPEQKAELENLGARQGELSRGQQNLEAKLDEMANKLEQSDPMAASALREAAKQSRSRKTSAKMAEAGEQLNQNKTGEARRNQEQARNDLKDLLDTLQNRRERELARLVQELKQAEQDLKDLRTRQAQNLKKAEQARQNPDPKAREKELQKLAKEQAEIQKQLEKQLQKLAKLGADSAKKSGDKAAGKMSKAEQGLNQDQGEKAEEDMEDALDDLRKAQQDLAQQRRDAEEQLAVEQIAKMADALRGIHERQEKMVAETAKYEKARADNGGRLTLTQRSTVRDVLGPTQAGLKDEAADLIERLGEGAPVFTLTLKRAVGAMDEAAGRLRESKTDEPTLVAERSAAARFKQLLDSLRPDKAKKKDGDGGDQQGGGQGGAQAGDGIPAAAQIKMLRMLQAELNERTEYFDELGRRSKPLTPDQTQERARLHEDQGALADLVRDLTRPKQPDGED